MASTSEAAPPAVNEQKDDNTKTKGTVDEDTVMGNTVDKPKGPSPRFTLSHTIPSPVPLKDLPNLIADIVSVPKTDEQKLADQLKRKEWKELREAEESDGAGGRSRRRSDDRRHRHDRRRRSDDNLDKHSRDRRERRNNRDRSQDSHDGQRHRRRDHRDRSRDRMFRGSQRGSRGRGGFHPRGRAYSAMTTEDHNRQRQNIKSNQYEAPESSDPDEIRRQVEFYLSDSNLPTDSFLLAQVGGSENKPILIKTLHNFTRMRRFQPYSAVVAALRESKVLNVFPEASKVTTAKSEDVSAEDGTNANTATATAEDKKPEDTTENTTTGGEEATTESDKKPTTSLNTTTDRVLPGFETVARKQPLSTEFSVSDLQKNRQILEDLVLDRSIYVKGFGGIGEEAPSTQTEIEAFFAPYGPINAVRLRRNLSKLFKGSVFVEFESKEGQEQFMGLEKKPMWVKPVVKKNVSSDDGDESDGENKEKKKKKDGKDNAGAAADAAEPTPLLFKTKSDYVADKKEERQQARERRFSERKSRPSRGGRDARGDGGGKKRAREEDSGSEEEDGENGGESKKARVESGSDDD